RMNAQSSQQILENRLRLKTSIVATKWLVKQASAFRGHDESVNSLNRGNFIELIKLLATMNEEINKVVLENAPNIAYKVRHKIREEVGDAKFCIIVDEALDKSHKEQIAINLRYVDCDGFIRKRFFEIANVDETKALTLKNEICNVLARYNLLVENLRSQWYDGASNMAGEWNGLQSLFLNDCPYVYYLHCFAHRLQLVLVAISKKLSSIINFASASFNRYSELKSAREKEIIDLIALEELETGTGANQVRTLQRAGNTRWSSHFTSISMFIEMFGATLETKSLDILNALNYVSSTKILLQEFRDSGWDDFIISVVSFCEKYDIIMLDMSDCYMEGTKSSCQRKDYVRVEDHYHFDIFNAVKDFQLIELNSRFSEQTVELLTLSSALDPIDGLIRLVLTLPISTATTERAFSATKLIKTSLRSKMENEEIIDTVDSDSVINDFYNSKPQKVQLR
ncbi:hypothetical protein CISIN_1g045230mg, partial [Citrus sinensis]